MKHGSWSSCSARMGPFPCFLWSQEFSLPGTWVLVLANRQSRELPLRLPLMWWLGAGVWEVPGISLLQVVLRSGCRLLPGGFLVCSSVYIKSS